MNSIISSLGNKWNLFVNRVVFWWSVNEWGNSPADWKPVIYIAIVALILAVILFFIFLALAAKGVVHSFCFWSSWTLIKVFAFYMIVLVGYRFGWSRWVWPVHWLEQRLAYAGAIATGILGFIVVFIAIGIIAWIIKQVLNGLCPLPSEGHYKHD